MDVILRAQSETMESPIKPILITDNDVLGPNLGSEGVFFYLWDAETNARRRSRSLADLDVRNAVRLGLRASCGLVEAFV